MTRVERTKWTREFYDTLAVELDSHLANGSEFIHLNGDEDAPAEVVDLRFKILAQEVRRLYSKGLKR
jgi:hypothetical protein